MLLDPTLDFWNMYIGFFFSLQHSPQLHNEWRATHQMVPHLLRERIINKLTSSLGKSSQYSTIIFNYNMNSPILRFQTCFCFELPIHFLDTLARAVFHDLHNSIRKLFCKEEKVINCFVNEESVWVSGKVGSVLKRNAS